MCRKIKSCQTKMAETNNKELGKDTLNKGNFVCELKLKFGKEK